MAGSTCDFQCINISCQSRISRQRAVFDGRVDAPNILVNDPSGAQIHMADF